MTQVLITRYSFPPAAHEADKSLRDYAGVALAITAFMEYTNIILEDDPLQVTLSLTPLTYLSQPRHQGLLPHPSRSLT
jgi:hypothetical protein